MTNTELQEQALKKYNNISMGNGSEHRMIKLYNIHQLLSKATLTDADVAQLKHFVNSSKQEIENTAYTANTVVTPMSWGHYTTQLPRKRTYTDK